MRLMQMWLCWAALAFGQYGVRHAAVERDLAAWQQQGASASDEQLLSQVNALGASFQGFVPMMGSFTPGDYQANRELVRRSLSWLASVEARGYANSAVGRGVAGLYGTLGDYQNRPAFRSNGFGAGAAFGYAGAGRVSRRLYLGGKGTDRDVDRYARQLAGLGGGYGYGYGYPGSYRQARAPEGLEAVDFGPVEDNGKKPLPVPVLDLAKVPAEQRAAWEELRLQFTAVAARVHQAEQNLDALAQRLRRQGMDVNAGDRAVAYQMDGFLQDSAALMVALDFAKAKLALERASYLCNRLKTVVGG